MSSSLLARLGALDVCAVSDAMDALGLAGVATGLPRRSGSGVLAGEVVTVMLAEGPAPAGTPKIHLGARAIEMAGPDSVIVVDHPGSDAGGWGGVLSRAAQFKGVRGVVVDGPLRDADEAAAIDFPIYSRATTARTARGRVHETGTNVPVIIGGMVVAPGDLVIADGSGVAFLPVGEAEAIIKAAERIAAKEGLMIEALRSGKPASAVLGADYEDMLGELR